MNFGDYQIRETLSESGLAQTFRADHLVLKIPVVLRRWNAEKLAAFEKPEEFVHRTQTATSLNHPHLLAVLDAGLHDETPYTAVEFTVSADLGALVAAMGPLPQTLACEYIRQAAVGLQTAHDAGYFHGWLSPAALQLTPVTRQKGISGEESLRPAPGATVKVADIGLLPHRPAIHEREYDPNADLGPVEFLPPERIAGTLYDEKTDVYGLGLCLYSLLAGAPPFRDPSPIQTLLKIQQSPAPKLSALRDDLDPELVDLVMRLLAKSPSDRPGLVETIQTLQIFSGSVETAAPTLEPLEEQEHHDPFAESESTSESDDESSYTPRVIRPQNEGHLFGISTRGYLIIGGILNFIAVILLVLYFTGAFDSKPIAPHKEPPATNKGKKK